MGARELEAAGNTFFVPAFIPHPDDCPAGVICVGEICKGKHGQVQLERHRIAFEKAFHGMVIGLVAKFPRDNPHNFAGVNRRVELLHIQHIPRHGIGIAMALASGPSWTLIHETQHALHHKPTGFVSHDGALDPRLTTAFRNGFGPEDDRPNDFVIMLNVVNELQLILRKVLRSRHAHTSRPRRARCHVRSSASRGRDTHLGLYP